MSIFSKIRDAIFNRNKPTTTEGGSAPGTSAGTPGSTDDTATMNIWLHKQVMQKLAANGGKVPQELL